MTTLPNMGIILATPGGDSGSWDDKINAGFGLVDAHDHTPGKGVQIPTAALSIDDDLPFGGFGATGVGRVAFNAVTALVAGSKTLFVSSSDNELYWRTNSGTNVKLTSGASINTTLVGGIVGDYTSVGAALAFDDANKRYTFKDQSAKWARLASGPVRIFEYNTTESVYVEQTVDAALAASYTVTWPAALPGSTVFMQISTEGVVSFTNTLPADTNITLSGGGRVITGERRYTCPIHTGLCITAGTVSTNTGAPGSIVAAATTVYYPIFVPGPGWYETGGGLVKLTKVRITSDSGSANNTTYSVVRQTGAQIATFSADVAGTPTTTTADSVMLTLTTPEQIDEIVSWVKVVTDSGSTRTFLTLTPYFTQT